MRIQRNSVYILLYKEIKLISTLCLEKERNSAVLFLFIKRIGQISALSIENRESHSVESLFDLYRESKDKWNILSVSIEERDRIEIISILCIERMDNRLRLSLFPFSP